MRSSHVPRVASPRKLGMERKISMNVSWKRSSMSMFRAEHSIQDDVNPPALAPPGRGSRCALWSPETHLRARSKSSLLAWVICARLGPFTLSLCSRRGRRLRAIASPNLCNPPRRGPPQRSLKSQRITYEEYLHVGYANVSSSIGRPGGGVRGLLGRRLRLRHDETEAAAAAPAAVAAAAAAAAAAAGRAGAATTPRSRPAETTAAFPPSAWTAPWSFLRTTTEAPLCRATPEAAW